MNIKKVGLLAGVGKLPVECARVAKQIGLDVAAVALLPDTDQTLKDYVNDYIDINAGQLEAILSYLKEKQVTHVTMLGKVTKEYLFSGQLQPDARMMQLVMSAPDHKDDTMMLLFVRELENAGMQVLDQTILVRELFPKQGTLTSRVPTEAERRDIAYGLEVARELGRLDIGQTVVVKDMAVMALEAIEGTDACIKRGCELARQDAVVVKVEKLKQDNRFDVPTVGLNTIEVMVQGGAKVLALEAGKTLLVDREKVIQLADEHGIAIEAV